MLIRERTDGEVECIAQEHHAFLSGVLAGAWLPSSIEPELVQAIGLHDNPWRAVDADPMFDEASGLPYDFVAYPVEAKVEFYRDGIDALESVHPWVAYLVSRHYTTFAGTKDVEALTEPEAERRERLEDRLREPVLEASERAMEWMKYFDIFSLYVAQNGPSADDEEIPPWLRDWRSWSEAPDGTPLELEWQGDERLALEPWPFAAETLSFDLEYRRLPGRFSSEAAFREAWSGADRGVRTLEFVRERSGG